MQCHKILQSLLKVQSYQSCPKLFLLSPGHACALTPRMSARPAHGLVPHAAGVYSPLHKGAVVHCSPAPMAAAHSSSLLLHWRAPGRRNHLRKLLAGHRVCLPFFLRAFSTALPDGVCIRALNPLVLVLALHREAAYEEPQDLQAQCAAGLADRRLADCSCRGHHLTFWCLSS